jgi:hypothetical protein
VPTHECRCQDRIRSDPNVGLVDGLTVKLVLPRGVGGGGVPGFQAVSSPGSLYNDNATIRSCMHFERSLGRSVGRLLCQTPHVRAPILAEWTIFMMIKL